MGNKKTKITKIRITKNIERVLLTEVLPYEVPLIFSNRYFYAFCLRYGLAQSGENKGKENVKIFFKEGYTIPFSFAISREGQNPEPRTLSIIHPAKQIEIVKFYKEYKDAMLYYASQSPFSIRKPVKVGEYYYNNVDKNISDLGKEENNLDIQNTLEIDQHEGEHFKSFFSYYRYGNIYKFYESRQYQDCEKKFLNLYRFDISKCFDNIYTHTIAWAIYSKNFVKRNLNEVKGSFAGKIDKLMQALNYNETHGILIGSEFSRLFAEIILQKIDKNVYLALEEKEYTLGVDYRVFRYVDDYFLFYNDQKVRDIILEEYILSLKEFKMSINKSKIHQYTRPIITELSIVKKKIRDYVLNQFFLKEFNANQKINANEMITDIKIFIKNSGAEYRGIVNYLLALLLTVIQKRKDSLFKEEIRNVFEMLDFLFFVFCAHISVSSINRITHIIKEMLEISKKFKLNEQSRIVDKIFFEIERLVKRSLNRGLLQSKEIYLLILLREKEIYKYRQIEASILKDLIEKIQNLSYFDIVILLFYMQDDEIYSEANGLLLKKIEEKCNALKQQFEKDIFIHTEATLLFLDLMSCPFIKKEQKAEIMSIYGISQEENVDFLNLIEEQEYWFVKWTDFNLLEEIQYKKSSETYS